MRTQASCSLLSNTPQLSVIGSCNPVALRAASYYTSHHKSCLPTSSLDFFYSSCLQHILRCDGLGRVSTGLTLEGLDWFHHSCVQHSLRHPEGGLCADSLPIAALDWFHFSAMRRLLHNSGKCLMPTAALDVFVGSSIQQAMAHDLDASFEAILPQVRTHNSTHNRDNCWQLLVEHLEIQHCLNCCDIAG